ncbi:hypothetical protein K402DRAFT_69158 [Aulographum hederae CBS 113979]|uniref:Zf-UBP-domain-containing protein n=1 Tax=Aulographum hederae CBS 113979 TaxID=1176131 RepID=A0A6G1HF22_9PEZI|nr:hypothetical protein K402DRAFT_69158 [Aulographum hederae CBS 113979]
MPSYFYHISFELYTQHPDTQKSSSAPTLGDSFLPPSGSSIFSADLPNHKAQYQTLDLKPRLHRRTKTAASRTELHQESAKGSSLRLSFIGQRPPLNTFSSSGNISNRPVPIRDRDKPAETIPPHTAAKDWRFGRVSVQSVDMELRAPEDTGRQTGKAVDSGTSANPSAGGLATRGRYTPSNPKNTEFGWGVVHLYREADETPGLYDDSAFDSASASAHSGKKESAPFDEKDCTTLCILAVPSYMTPSDLLGFLGEQTREDVSHFRLIRTGKVNRYMVLIKFREARNAKLWQKKWNGRLFNSMEEEICHVVFVKSIEFQTADAARGPSSFPSMSNDPFTPATTTDSTAPTAPLPATSATSPETTTLTNLATKPPAPATPLIELPTCPVCLERMDETTGLLTILCQHVFHCGCLEKWRGGGCPVCRYTQNEAFTLPGRRGTTHDDTAENQCSVCGTTNNLWICLICGNTGCGRYDAAHAFAHYEATSHCYAMDVATQHVWDYAGDGYVHRLVQNKADGKLVDLPSAALNGGNGAMTGFGSDTMPREKVEAMGVEYTYLLTSQLESQRKYYDDQLERAVDKAAKAAASADKAATNLEAMEAKFADLRADYEAEHSSKKDLEKDVARLERRVEKAETLARKLGNDWREEKSINEGLIEKNKYLNGQLDELKVRVGKLEEEKAELEDTNRDLNFFISGSAKMQELQEAGEDVVDGTVEVGSKKKRKGKKKSGV